MMLLKTAIYRKGSIKFAIICNNISKLWIAIRKLSFFPVLAKLQVCNVFPKSFIKRT